LPAKIWIFVAHSQEARQFWAVKVFPAQSGAKKVLLLLNISFPAFQLASESIYGHRGREDLTVKKNKRYLRGDAGLVRVERN
jgi:hypothetical protein